VFPLLGFLLVSCISSNPPAPPVRWFDPTPPRVALDARRPVRVTSAAFLRQDFVVRIPPYELSIDDSLRWVAPPEQLVAAALDNTVALPADLSIEVVRFEFEVGDTTRAVVELLCASEGRTVPVRVRCDAISRAPEQLAVAMAQALSEVSRAVVAAVVKGG
jgi:hypothetical protein